jgi:hypothetical protein
VGGDGDGDRSSLQAPQSHGFEIMGMGMKRSVDEDNGNGKVENRISFLVKSNCQTFWNKF